MDEPKRGPGFELNREHAFVMAELKAHADGLFGDVRAEVREGFAALHERVQATRERVDENATAATEIGRDLREVRDRVIRLEATADVTTPSRRAPPGLDETAVRVKLTPAQTNRLLRAAGWFSGALLLVSLIAANAVGIDLGALLP